jgi:hypothetical protein
MGRFDARMPDFAAMRVHGATALEEPVAAAVSTTEARTAPQMAVATVIVLPTLTRYGPLNGQSI